MVGAAAAADAATKIYSRPRPTLQAELVAFLDSYIWRSNGGTSRDPCSHPYLITWFQERC